MFKLTELLDYKIYVDMDGVISDFDKQFETLIKYNSDKYEDKYGKKAFWSVIGKLGVKFWTEMPWMSDGKQLWNFVKDKNVSILSSPPSTKQDNARKGKIAWCKKHLGNVEVILEREKQKYANPRAILIDDTKKKIDKFKANGGIGILHKNTAKTISELKEILNG